MRRSTCSSALPYLSDNRRSFSLSIRLRSRSARASYVSMYPSLSTTSNSFSDVMSALAAPLLIEFGIVDVAVDGGGVAGVDDGDMNKE